MRLSRIASVSEVSEESAEDLRKFVIQFQTSLPPDMWYEHQKARRNNNTEKEQWMHRMKQ